MMHKLKEADIQLLLWKMLAEKRIFRVFPNIQLNRYEADLVALTRSGFLHEYEIKTTKADYLRDFRAKIGKHGQMEHKSFELKPNYFWVVAAFEIERIEDFPPYAGLLEVCQPKGKEPSLKVHKSAARLHKRKVSDQFIQKLMIRGLFKYWNLLEKHLQNN